MGMTTKTLELEPGALYGTTYPAWIGDEACTVDVASPIAGTVRIVGVDVVEGVAVLPHLDLGLAVHVDAGGETGLITVPPQRYIEVWIEPDAPLDAATTATATLRGCQGIGL